MNQRVALLAMLLILAAVLAGWSWCCDGLAF